jgi:hypothetical protein
MSLSHKPALSFNSAYVVQALSPPERADLKVRTTPE